MKPIVCVGEALDERNAGQTKEVLRKQIENGFNNLEGINGENLILAYEPIWAIGTGTAADIKSIENNIQIIKNIINNINTKNCNIYLLYGGSVDENNASDIFSIDDVNGFWIGASSLDAKRFYDIYRQI